MAFKIHLFAPYDNLFNGNEVVSLLMSSNSLKSTQLTKYFAEFGFKWLILPITI